MIAYIGKLLKKILKSKPKLILSTLVTTWISKIAFHLQPIWLQTLIANDSESCQSFCALPSEVTVLFDLMFESQHCKQMLFSWTSNGYICCFQVLCTGFDRNMQICSYHSMSHFYSETHEWLSKAMSTALIGKNFFSNSIENFNFPDSNQTAQQLQMAVSKSLKTMYAFVNYHVLYYWPSIHNLILKICPTFQVHYSQFSLFLGWDDVSEINELLNEHWTKIVLVQKVCQMQYYVPIKV